MSECIKALTFSRWLPWNKTRYQMQVTHCKVSEAFALASVLAVIDVLVAKTAASSLGPFVWWSPGSSGLFVVVIAGDLIKVLLLASVLAFLFSSDVVGLCGWGGVGFFHLAFCPILFSFPFLLNLIKVFDSLLGSRNDTQALELQLCNSF